MESLFASGRIVDLILGLTVVEAFALIALHRWTGRPAPAAVLPNLLSGMCLLAALRVALSGGWWGWMALALSGALAAHVADLTRTWRGGPDR